MCFSLYFEHCFPCQSTFIVFFYPAAVPRWSVRFFSSFSFLLGEQISCMRNVYFMSIVYLCEAVCKTQSYLILAIFWLIVRACLSDCPFSSGRESLCRYTQNMPYENENTTIEPLGLHPIAESQNYRFASIIIHRKP